MISLYLGFNLRIQKRKTYTIINKYFKDFSAFEVDGFYQGKRVKTLKIEILTGDKTKINKLKNELKFTFKQKDILVV